MSETHVALLRGINVGGRNKLPMATLRALFEAAGAADVRTYIQSGNVVFRVAPGAVEALAVRVRAALAGRLGLAVPLVTRSAVELGGVLRANPFLGEDVDEQRLHVAFLAARPAPEAVAALDPQRSPPDRLAVVGSEVFLHLPNGVGRSRITNAWLDRTLGTTSTVRNWRTVGELHKMASATAPPA